LLHSAPGNPLGQFVFKALFTYFCNNVPLDKASRKAAKKKK
jgi:hypothetical protein